MIKVGQTPLKSPRLQEHNPTPQIADKEIRHLIFSVTLLFHRDGRFDFTYANASVRDQALLGILYGCGLHRAEAVALNVGDDCKDANELNIRSGKGNKQRAVYLPPSAKSALEKWLWLCGESVGYEEEGPLFLPVLKGKEATGGRIVLRRLTDQSVMDILLQRAKQAGLKKTSSHDFRRTFMADLLHARADIATVQKMAGHSNVTTTARYDR